MSWDDFVQTLSWDEETIDEEQWELYIQSLEYLHYHPMNINSASPDDLAQIPFLTPTQIEDIVGYINMDGQMKSLGELHLIPSIDPQTRRILPLFLVAEPIEKNSNGIKSWFAGMKNSVDTRMDIPLYYRKGYLLEDGYAGNPLYHRIRYTLESKNVLAGLNVKKDQGERFYDSFGGYLMIKDRGIVRQAIVGDFRAGWGEGLVLSERTGHSKDALISGTGKGLRPMTGTSETAFLRGIAITLGSDVKRKTNLQGTILASLRQWDATLDSLGNAKTLVTTGYHRTATELERKNNTLEALVGAHFMASFHHFTVGMTGYWQHFDRKLSPGNEVYRRFYPEGTDFGNIGLHAGYSHYRLTASAEVAYSTSHNGIATLGRVQYIAFRWLKLAALGRYYSHKYYTLHGYAIGEGSHPQNETGFLFRTELNPWRNWTFTSYFDFFSDYWPRYQMTHSSKGQEFLLSADYILPHQSKRISTSEFSLRYQLKRKEAQDIMIPHHRIRGQYTLTTSSDWRFQTTGSLHLVQEPTKNAVGWSVSEMVKGHFFSKKLRLGIMASYFDTPDYLSRIYIYEPTLWSSTSSGSVFGQGIRSVLTLRWTFPHSHWMIEGKYGITHMLDRNTITTGLQTIYSPTKQDISLQIRMMY